MGDLTKGAPIYSESDSDDRVHSKILDAADPDGVGKQASVSDNELHTKARTMDGNGNANSPSNPIFVNEVSSGQTVEDDDDEAVDVAKNASASHTFSPAADSNVKKLIFTSSGSAKFEVQIGAPAGEVRKFVAMIGDQGGTKEIDIDYNMPVLSTDNIKIVKTNLAPAQSLYSYVALENS